MPFVCDARLMVKKGMTGATGNVYCGLHDFDSMAFLLHVLRHNDVFIDAGANVGSYTILASAVIGAKSISIEPIPSTFQSLLDNVYCNRIQDRTCCLNYGLASHNGTMRFTIHDDTKNRVIVNGIDSSSTIMVDVTTLDQVVREHNPLLIKIDVEGYESEVVAGGERILSQDNVLAVIMEYGRGSEYGFNDTSLHSTMGKLSFKPFTYSPFTRQLHPAAKYSRSGNTIYIRDPLPVNNRISTAPKFCVNRQLF
jgi:FkbM family methyltransferase